METQRDNQSKRTEAVNLNDLPFLKSMALAVLFGAMLWGIYIHAGTIASRFPIGTYRFLHFLCSILYFFVSMIALLLGGSVLYKGLQSARWSESESDLFYGAILVSLLFLITGLQFLLSEIWMAYSPFLFLLGKIIVTGLLIGFLVRGLQKRKSP